MTTLLMTSVIRSIVRFAGAETVGAARPAELHLTLTDHAKFVICDHTIEQCFEETKTELGMDHYEVRKYPGWHHHILISMLAHFFLWHLKLRLGKKSACPHRVAAPD